MFKKKSKKSSSSLLPPPPPSDANLEDVLFAQLDAQDKPNAEPASQSISHSGVSTSTITTSTSADSTQSSKLQKPKKDSKLRFKAREARKALKLESSSKPSDPVADARLEQEAKDEERDIKRVCDQLGLEMVEVQPDGHCLFAAVADQLALHGVIPRSTASYTTTRMTAANYMLANSDAFLPFLPSVEGEDGAGATNDGIMSPKQYARYCAAIRETAAWGGEPEILALSRAYNIPIHVVQAGKPPVVIHEPIEGMSDIAGMKVVFISYHRRMYGLGEHYNSLRPRLHLPPQPPIQFMGLIH